MGQNFMRDAQALADITAAARLSPGAPVLEVGPGTGALTRHLLAAGAAVTAVEKDYGLHDRLAEEFAEVGAGWLVVVGGWVVGMGVDGWMGGIQCWGRGGGRVGRAVEEKS
jgi:16S rRNA (adenine1518-N6/adenine1519-N6)-dimethyltransferase